MKVSHSNLIDDQSCTFVELILGALSDKLHADALYLFLDAGWHLKKQFHDSWSRIDIDPIIRIGPIGLLHDLPLLR